VISPRSTISGIGSVKRPDGMSLRPGHTSLRKNSPRSSDAVVFQGVSNRALTDAVSFIVIISEPAARWGLEPSNQLRGRSLARPILEMGPRKE